MTSIFKVILNAFLILPILCSGQRTWKVEKEQDNIKVFSSVDPVTNLKSIRVECTLAGNFAKLIDVLTNVPEFTTWIYHAKNCSLVQSNSELDYIYFTETELPWPMSNREGRIHVTIGTDSLPHFVTITGHLEPDFVPIDGAVAIEHYTAHWMVTMPSDKTIFIEYELILNPGGSIPVWVSNMFASNGPYETFHQLGEKLKE